jgi:hypothetical protein
MRCCFRAHKIRVTRSLLACATWVLSSVAVSACTPHLRIEDLPPEQIETSLFLIGDAGEPDPRHSETALDSMSAQAAAAPGGRSSCSSATTFIQRYRGGGKSRVRRFTPPSGGAG